MIEEKNMYFYALERACPNYEYANVIWAEDLYDAKIIVYTGNLKTVPGYSVSTTDDYILAIVRHADGTVYAPSVRADVESQRVYIAYANFRMWWKNIKKSISDYLLFNDISGSADDVVDMSRVNAQIKSKVIEIPETQKQKKEANQRKAYFFKILGEELIHDRDCAKIGNIPEKKLIAVDDFSKSSKACERCEYKALIRKACLPDGNAAKIITRMFEGDGKNRVGLARLRKYVLEDNLCVTFTDLNTITVKANEDTWQMRKTSETQWCLWHNNYSVVAKGIRIFDSGFHDQGVKGTLTYLLDHIASYQWNEWHQEASAKNLRKTYDPNDNGEVRILGKNVPLSEKIDKVKEERNNTLRENESPFADDAQDIFREKI